MEGQKIRCPCRKCKSVVFKTPDEVNFDLYMKGFMPEYYWTSHGEERVQEYFEAVTAPHLQDEQNPPAPAEEGTSTNWGDAAEMNWAQRMVSDAAGQAYNEDCAVDDGTRSCPLDVGPSSYYYGGDPYDYVHGLTHRFQDVLHVAEQPLWNGCTTSQLAAVAELVDIKVDGQLSERIYDRISQWGDHIMPHDHSFPVDYYNMKKLIKDLGLPMEKINACKNGFMLYWKGRH
ncbi:UNVERIFIED_CONTAM: hypothetical protein Slati_0938800 [Sesamum latifolium]|uniref:Transposase-associated domain-containing protein n=1 Tax=Sesamum latifolium TaxID=2727402 RepID=A0AAW2XUI9_9LAMI